MQAPWYPSVERWRHLDPYALVHRGEAWYATVWCHKHKTVRVFRLDRIRGVQQTAMRFERPAEFDPSAFFEGAWSVFHGDDPVVAIVQFDRAVAPLIERARHHSSEEKRMLSDGSLEYRVRLEHLDELARWVAGFGGAARAIEPAELVARVEQIASGALAVHGQSGRELCARQSSSV